MLTTTTTITTTTTTTTTTIGCNHAVPGRSGLLSDTSVCL